MRRKTQFYTVDSWGHHFEMVRGIEKKYVKMFDLYEI